MCKAISAVVLALVTVLPARAASPIELLVDKGKASAFYGSATDAMQSQMLEVLKRGQYAERMATVVNGTLLLRRNLNVGFTSCGRENAFFNPQSSSIVICTEFLALVMNTAKDDTEFMMKQPRDVWAKFIDGVLWSVFLHELGHAVIAIDRVPVTGREEDVADQFGAWFALNFMPLDRQPVIMPSLWLWTRLGKQQNIPSMSDDQRRQFLANEHSLDEQRVYNIACMAVGAHPENAQPLIAAVKLPTERAQRCPGEYAQVNYAMEKEFRKFFKVKPLRGSW